MKLWRFATACRALGMADNVAGSGHAGTGRRLLRLQLPRRAAAACALVLTSLTALTVSATPAYAVTCYGYSCHGHDPVIYGCSATSSDGPYYAVDPADDAPVAWIQNRYSYGCNANWSRGQLTSVGIARGYKIYVDVSTTDSNNQTEWNWYPGPSNTGALQEWRTNWPTGGYGGSLIIFTDMVDGTHITYSTVWVHNSTGSILVNWAPAQQ